MNICSHTFEEYVEMVRCFHSYPAPGVLIGGFMVDKAYQCLPEEGLFDAICETQKCLPDAVQLLTPCTIGNGWLRVVNLGRYALTLYDKHSGAGMRVFLDPAKLEPWQEIKNWFFKLKDRKEQESPLLLKQIKEAGTSVCTVHEAKVDLDLLGKARRGAFAICPRCKEAYPLADGKTCLGCQGKIPYLTWT